MADRRESDGAICRHCEQAATGDTVIDGRSDRCVVVMVGRVCTVGKGERRGEDEVCSAVQYRTTVQKEEQSKKVPTSSRR